MKPPSPPRPKPPSPEDLHRANRGMRRVVVLGMGGIGAALAGLTVGLPIIFAGAEPPQRFSNHRVVPPLLRAPLDPRAPGSREARQRGTPPGDLAANEALLVLVRAEMRDKGAPQESPAPREMLQLWTYAADDIWFSHWTRVAVVAPGGAPDARLIAAQGGTVWIWADGLVAAAPGSFDRGADAAELARLNPGLGLDRPGLRARLNLAEALILDGSPANRDGWAFDPATRIAAPRAEPRAAPLPPIFTPGLEGPALAREGLAGDTWFGLLPVGMTIPGAVAAQAGGGFLPPTGPGPARLWRGRLRGAAQQPGAPPKVLDAAEPVPGLDPLPAGGLLMAGPGRPLELAGPPSILLARVGRLGGTGEWVRRLRLDGTPLWNAELPTAEEIASVLVEPGRLWLLTRPRGMMESLHAIAPTDGRIVRTRHWS